jgi:hypothetical protein
MYNFSGTYMYTAQLCSYVVDHFLATCYLDRIGALWVKTITVVVVNNCVQHS